MLSIGRHSGNCTQSFSGYLHKDAGKYWGRAGRGGWGHVRDNPGWLTRPGQGTPHHYITLCLATYHIISEEAQSTTASRSVSLTCATYRILYDTMCSFVHFANQRWIVRLRKR